MSNELLIEIGTEEIPALFLEESTQKFREILAEKLTGNSLGHEDISILYTPRRIAVRITGLPSKQEDRIVENFGPPSRIAFDSEGKPTKAAEGFARSQGVSVSELSVAKRDNGEFLSYRKEIKGDRTENILRTLIPESILSIPFRKSMRWGQERITFARPIRWLMCIYNSTVIEFTIEGVRSSSSTRGHRFANDNLFQPANWEDYKTGLKERYVIADQAERKKTILDEAMKIASSLNAVLDADEELISTVTNLVEYPVVMKGEFDSKFLTLPQEVLTSVMKNHQKYFPLFNNDKTDILPTFIFVCGTPIKKPEIVIRGNERVLRARLSDGEFFYQEDTKTPLIEKLDGLKDMVFLSGIGNYYEKVMRLEKLSGFIGSYLALTQDMKEGLSRAALLCKADLVTQMVFEFPELQGVMGKYYALSSGEKEEVASAIEEHYMPAGRDTALPEGILGSLLSISDKIDNITSCFAAGLKPTGSADPYALRRQAIGIVQIVIEKKLDLELSEILRRSADNLTISFDREDTLSDTVNFISERFRNFLTDRGYSLGTVDSVLATGFENILDSFNRIKAVESFRKEKDFDELAIAFKRVVNIAKDRPITSTDVSRFRHDSEKRLYETLNDIKSKTDGYLSGSLLPSETDYLEALRIIRSLKEPVDDFFDSVMVMDKDEKLKNNRLALLYEIKELFFRISDFSRI